MVAVLWALCACGGNRQKSPRVERSPAVTATIADCADSVETRALACSGGTARRVGNTLFVRLGTGAETRFVDKASAEDEVGYRYMGRVASNRFHIVERNGDESEPTYHLVNAASGWGALELQWRSVDTLAFLREEFAAIDTSVSRDGPARRIRRPMMAVHAGNEWRIVAPASR